MQPRPGSADGTDDGGAVAGAERLYLPTGPSDQVVHHAYFSVGYEEDWEQPRWVAYRLEPANLRGPRVRRSGDFRPDPAVRTGSADGGDYRRSGYSRGHLVPAGDMAFDARAMSETFFYSNVSPQLIPFNGGVWRELEERCRAWAADQGLYVLAGPLVGASAKTIGPDAVAVPDAFWRVLLTDDGRAIAFVIPHVATRAPLVTFATSVDSVEALSGLDLFPELPALASPEVEAATDFAGWFPASSHGSSQPTRE